MAKQININWKGVDYTLEFTRKSVQTLEKRGFLIGELADKPMSTLPELFAGAFLAHHPFVKRSVVDEIYDAATDKMQLIHNLAEMYNEPVAALTSDPEEGESGNATWTANW